LRGLVRPYVAGQKVMVRITQNDRRVASITRTVLRGPSGSAGSFLIAYKPRSSGPLTVTASHLRTDQLGAAAAKPVAVDVLPRAVPQGSKGLPVRVMQRHLKALGYVTGDPGHYDAHTQRAVLAFRKQTGMSRIASADKPFFQKLAAGAGAFKVRYPNHGRHVEGDLTHQTLALIGAGGKVERVYPISSGKPSTPTVLGTYRIYRKDYGTNAKGMVDASYFYNGYAIHGYAEVPTYAASHGCLRAPVPDARSISDWLRHGTIVDVYYR
ncbi:MAG: L,D-transpeptidase, partial [Solirubrobacterales bacterium]|nr:L,D-transpeptidase [Solirubrobacterales bacterium]